MKYGNVSHTIIRIPQFFYGTKNRNLETFMIPPFKKYYKEKDLINNPNELNFNNNRKIISCSKEEKNHYSSPEMTFESTINTSPYLKKHNKLFDNYTKYNSYSNIFSSYCNYNNNINNKLFLFRNSPTNEKFFNSNNSNLHGEDLFHQTLRDKVLSLHLISDKTKLLYTNKNWCIEGEKSFERTFKNSPKISFNYKFKKNKHSIMNNTNNDINDNTTNNYGNSIKNNVVLKKTFSLPNINQLKK